MASRVEIEIKKANEFGDRIEDLVIARGQVHAGDRNTLLLAYWSLTCEFHRGVLCLLSNKFFGAAFALVRPILEAVVRASVVIMGSEEDLRKLREDEYKINFATVGKEMDANFGTGYTFEKFLIGARKALHSYTHVGTLQLNRRFSEGDLMPNYPEEEIIDAIRTTTSAVFFVNCLVTKHLGYKDEWMKCNELFQELANHS